MEIQYSSFELKDVDENGTSAGVIPFSRNERGQVVVLLGRERFNSKWKGSCRWSGFEGGRNRGETLDETCDREFVEETLGVIGNLGPRIKKGDYWKRIITRVTEEVYTKNRYHQTIVAPISYEPDAGGLFSKKRESIEYIDYCSRIWRHTVPAFISKFDEIGDVVGDNDMYVVACCKASDVVETVEVRGNANVQELEEWLVCRKRLERSLIDHHPCVVVERSRWGTLRNVSVRKEHIEKDQLRWWTVPELQQVMSNHGVLHLDRFRPYFLPVLQVVLSALASKPPSELEWKRFDLSREGVPCEDLAPKVPEPSDEDRVDAAGRTSPSPPGARAPTPP